MPLIVLPGGAARAARVARWSRPPAPTAAPDAPAGSIVNGGQTGYFRVLYRDGAFTAVAGRLASLPPSDQLGLIDDVEALGNAGREPMADFLSLAARLPAGADPILWMMIAEQLTWLDVEHEGLESQAAFRGFSRGLLGSKLRLVGFDPVPGEPDNTAILRSGLLSSLGSLGDAAVLAEARRRFSAYVRDPSTLSGAARESVLTIVATNADFGDMGPAPCAGPRRHVHPR